MVKPPNSAKTREGLLIPSFSLNQPMVESPISPMTFFSSPIPAFSPLISPSIIIPPNSVNRPGSSMPRYFMTAAKA
ncbi:hypothetical protein D3C78_1693000 [compost metagenome]